MNNALNMQLVEQITAVDVSTNSSPQAFCQQLYDITNTNIHGNVSLFFSQLQDGNYQPIIQLPTDATPPDVPDTINTQVEIKENIVNLPIVSDGETNGLFQFMIEDQDSITAVNWQVIRQVLQHCLAPILKPATSLAKTQQEAITTLVYQILNSENDVDLTRLLFAQLPPTITHIAIYRADTPFTLNTQVDHLNLRILADTKTIIASNEIITFGDQPLNGDLVTNLLSGQLVYEKDIQTASHHPLPDALYTNFQDIPVHALTIVGLRVTHKLVGIMILGSQDKPTLSDLHQQKIRLSADQIGIAYETQQILRRAEVSLMESQLQYAIINDLVKADDLNAMTRVMLNYFGENASGAGIVEIYYDDNQVLNNAILRYQIKPNSPDIHETFQSITEFVDLEVLQNLNSQENSAIYYVEGNPSDYTQFPKSLFEKQNINSCILIPLSEEGQVQHIISLNWKDKQTFPQRTRRLLNVIRSQIDIIYENIQLLRTAQINSQRLAEQVNIQRQLNELANFAGTNRDEQRLLDKGTETLKNIMNVDHIGIMLIEDDGNFAYLASEFPKQVNELIRIPVVGSTWEN